MNPTSLKRLAVLRTVLVRVGQIIIAATFLFSGIAKCIDPTGTAIKITEYLDYFGFHWLTDWSMALSCLLCLTETMIGSHVLLGRTRSAVWMALLVMLGFTPLTLFLALENPVEDCGCFGDVVKLSNWQTFGKNVGLLLILLFLIRNLESLWRPLKPFVSASYNYGVFVLALILCWKGTFSLPFIDFRPYKHGTQLAPRQASESTSEYFVIYEKEGNRVKFALDSIPAADEGWEFIETIEEVRPAADTAETSTSGSSFFLTNEGYEDVTHDICDQEGYTFLLLSTSLDKADEGYLDRIESVYEYCREYDYPFYLVTLRDSTQLQRWHYKTGGEYPTLYSDASEITTVVRANPGLVLLHEGTILWKSSLPDIDISALTSAKLSEQTYGKIVEIDYSERILWVISLVCLPFCVLLLLQYAIKFINSSKK